MDICDKIDQFLCESVEDKVFETFKEASNYLRANFNGHGKILHWPSRELIRSCKCRHSSAQIVYSKELPKKDYY